VGFQSGTAKKLKPHQTPHHSGWMPSTLNITCSVLLINIHEYFSDQVCFHLHPACDAMFHLKRSSSASPFHMKVVEDNIAFLEYTSQPLLFSHLIFPLIALKRLLSVLVRTIGSS